MLWVLSAWPKACVATVDPMPDSSFRVVTSGRQVQHQSFLIISGRYGVSRSLTAFAVAGIRRSLAAMQASEHCLSMLPAPRGFPRAILACGKAGAGR